MITRVLIAVGIVSNLVVAYEMTRVVAWLRVVSAVLDGGCMH